MLRYLVPALVGLMAGTSWAQQAAPSTRPPISPSPAAVQTSGAATTKGNLAAGNYWTYETTDEITGKVSPRRTFTVTEVTPKDISVRIGTANTDGTALLVLDRSGNTLSSGGWKYTPHDGTGIMEPLTVGKTWTFKGSDVNAGNGLTMSRTGRSKVVSQESLTTKAGTFDTFKIETIFTVRNSKDPTGKAEVTAVTWYAPAINRWVKRSNVVRINDRLKDKSLIELTDYAPRQ